MRFALAPALFMLAAPAYAQDVEQAAEAFEADLMEYKRERKVRSSRAKSLAVEAQNAAPASAIPLWTAASDELRGLFELTLKLRGSFGALESALDGQPPYFYGELRDRIASTRTLVDDTTAFGMTAVVRMELRARRSTGNSVHDARVLSFLQEHDTKLPPALRETVWLEAMSTADSEGLSWLGDSLAQHALPRTTGSAHAAAAARLEAIAQRQEASMEAARAQKDAAWQRAQLLSWSRRIDTWEEASGLAWRGADADTARHFERRLSNKPMVWVDLTLEAGTGWGPGVVGRLSRGPLAISGQISTLHRRDLGWLVVPEARLALDVRNAEPWRWRRVQLGPTLSWDSYRGPALGMEWTRLARRFDNSVGRFGVSFDVAPQVQQARVRLVFGKGAPI